MLSSLVAGHPVAQPAKEISIQLKGLRFPPKDLDHTLTQQLWVLELCREICGEMSLPRDLTGVFIGMGCDSEIARYGARWRLAEWASQTTPNPSSADRAWLRGAQDAFVHSLEAAGVVGTMPNIPANRINSQLDLAGSGFSLSSEEHSGVSALRAAGMAGWDATAASVHLI